MAKQELNFKVLSLTLATFFSVVYVLCVVYGFVWPNTLHHQLFEIFPGVKWMDATSFVVGLVENFVLGIIVGVIFVSIYNYFLRKYG